MEGQRRVDFSLDDIQLTPLFFADDHITNTPVLPKALLAYGPVSFPEPPTERPYIVSSIVLSADGKMAFEDDPRGPVIASANVQDPGGALADFWVLNMLRAYADGCIIGAMTLQAEADCIARVMDRELFEQRRDILGKQDDPVNIVVSLDGTDIPLGHDLFKAHLEGTVSVVIATGCDGEKFLKKQQELPIHFIHPGRDDGSFSRDAVPVLVTGNQDKPDTQELLAYLRKQGISMILSESPGYTAHLADMGLLDEYFINYSLLLAGGKISPASGVTFSSTDHPSCRLLSASMHSDRFIYTRLQLEYSSKE